MDRRAWIKYWMTRDYLEQFFHNSVKENRIDAITAWTQRSFYGEYPILLVQQEAFFVAERIVLTDYLVNNKLEEFRMLIGAFDVLYQHDHFFKMKEFDVLFFAVLCAEDRDDRVVKNEECKRLINNIIQTTFSDMCNNQELKEKYEELERLLGVGRESSRETNERHTNSDDEFVER